MASKQSDELKRLYQEWVATTSSSPAMSLEEWRDMVEHWAEVTAEPREVDYVETVIAGDMPAMWVLPHGAVQDRVLLCIHGGGFVTGSMFTHRKLFAHFRRQLGSARSSSSIAAHLNTSSLRNWTMRLRLIDGCSTKGSRRIRSQ